VTTTHSSIPILLAEEAEARAVDHLHAAQDVLEAGLADVNLTASDRIKLCTAALALHARLEARADRLKAEAEKAEKRKENDLAARRVRDMAAAMERRTLGIPE
jgi:hypothetical protein